MTGFEEVALVLALLAISGIITALITKKPQGAQNPTPATLKDFNIPQIAEGTPQAVVFGDCWMPDWQVLWYGNLRSEGIPAKTTGGAKK